MIRAPKDITTKDLTMLVLDVDGTLTDGGMYHGEDGSLFKRFDTRDGVGIMQWQQLSGKVALITGENSQAAKIRADKLHIEDVYLYSKNKAKDLRHLMEKHSLDRDNIIVMGDDINDLSMVGLCRYFACPADAHWRVLDAADIVTSARGGHGAVRELVDHLLGAPIDLEPW